MQQHHILDLGRPRDVSVQSYQKPVPHSDHSHSPLGITACVGCNADQTGKTQEQQGVGTRVFVMLSCRYLTWYRGAELGPITKRYNLLTPSVLPAQLPTPSVKAMP